MYFEYESESYVIMQTLHKLGGLPLDSAETSSGLQQGLFSRCTQHPAWFEGHSKHHKIVRLSTTAVEFSFDGCQPVRNTRMLLIAFMLG